LCQRFERWYTALVAKGIHRLRRATAQQPYGTCRGGLIETAPAGVLGRQLVMQPEFFFEIGVPSSSLQRSE
jgi:hypothetical protein